MRRYGQERTGGIASRILNGLDRLLACDIYESLLERIGNDLRFRSGIQPGPDLQRFQYLVFNGPDGALAFCGLFIQDSLILRFEVGSVGCKTECGIGNGKRIFAFIQNKFDIGCQIGQQRAVGIVGADLHNVCDHVL